MADGVLTEKQRRFVEHYLTTCNATESAKKAGYSGDENALAVQGHRNLRNPKVRAALDERSEGSPDVADRREQQALWSEFMRDRSLTPAERMKAAEMLCKSQGGLLPPAQQAPPQAAPMSDTEALRLIEGGGG